MNSGLWVVPLMNAEALRPVLKAWDLPALVWDGAPAYRARSLDALPTRRVLPPAYSPELNPAEPVFAEKQAAADVYPEGLQADPERIKQLCGWDWIRRVPQVLPPAKPHDRRHLYAFFV